MGATVEIESILRCPQCKGPLAKRGDRFDCDACLLGYPVRQGIPSFIVAEAQRLDAPATGNAAKPSP